MELLDRAGDPIAREALDVVEIEPGRIRLLQLDFGGNFYVRIRSVRGGTVPYTVEVLALVFE